MPPFDNWCLKSLIWIVGRHVGGGGGTGAQRSSVGFVSPARTGGRVGSAHRLVGGGSCLTPGEWPPVSTLQASGSAAVLFGGPFGKSRRMPAQIRRLTAARGVTIVVQSPLDFLSLRALSVATSASTCSMRTRRRVRKASGIREPSRWPT